MHVWCLSIFFFFLLFKRTRDAPGSVMEWTESTSSLFTKHRVILSCLRAHGWRRVPSPWFLWKLLWAAASLLTLLKVVELLYGVIFLVGTEEVLQLLFWREKSICEWEPSWIQPSRLPGKDPHVWPPYTVCKTFEGRLPFHVWCQMGSEVLRILIPLAEFGARLTVPSLAFPALRLFLGATQLARSWLLASKLRKVSTWVPASVKRFAVVEEGLSCGATYLPWVVTASQRGPVTMVVNQDSSLVMFQHTLISQVLEGNTVHMVSHWAW